METQISVHSTRQWGWTCIVVQHDPCDTPGVTEQLADIVAANSVCAVLLLANEPSVDNFVTPIMDEEAERSDDGL